MAISDAKWKYSRIVFDLADAFKTSDGKSVNDMYVDTDYEINTGELHDILDEADLADFIDNLNDWN